MCECECDCMERAQYEKAAEAIVAAERTNINMT